MITISDVAREAGVSISTVSNVINKKGTTKKETAELVLQTIERLGYVPNNMAQGLKSRRSNMIGIIAEDVRAFSSGEIIDGICEYAENENYTIRLCNLRVNRKVSTAQESDYKQMENSKLFRETIQNLVTSLLTSRICGLIYIGTYPRDVSKVLPEMDIPVVYAYSYNSSEGSYCVNYDDFQGAYTATTNLIQNGHKRIGLISGTVNSYPTHKRMLGYQTALMDHQIPFIPEYLCTGKWHYEDGYEQCKKLLALPNPPTAIFSMSDLMAYGAMNACMDQGLRIPQDISIHGFDDLELSPFTRPALTTVQLPLHKIGLQAGKTICTLVSGKTVETASQLIPCALIPRESVSALANSK